LNKSAYSYGGNRPHHGVVISVAAAVVARPLIMAEKTCIAAARVLLFG